MYDISPESWQDWLGLLAGGAIVVVVVWRIWKTPPL